MSCSTSRVRGPCLDAIITNGVVVVPDQRTDDRWSRFTPGDRGADPGAERPELPVVPDRAGPGGVEPVRVPPGGFTDESVVTGAVFAAYASMALVAAARQDRANHLLRALETNREIGVAMGILMATGELTQQQAFDGLRTASQHG